MARWVLQGIGGGGDEGRGVEVRSKVGHSWVYKYTIWHPGFGSIQGVQGEGKLGI